MSPFLLLVLLLVGPAAAVPTATNVQWFQDTATIRLARKYPASAAIDGKLYLIGGDEGSGLPVSSGEYYDPSLQGWYSAPSMDTANAVKYVSGIAIDGKIWVFGGVDRYGNSVDHVRKYDPANAVVPWTIENEMLGGARSHVQNPVMTLAGEVLFVNGLNMTSNLDGVPLNDTVTFNPSTGTWGYLNAPAPNQPRYGHGTAIIGNKVYITGGQTGPLAADRTNTMEVLDLDNMAAGWKTLPAMSAQRYYHQTVSYGGYIWVFGGIDATGTVLGTVEFYDPDATLTGTWYPYTSMPRIRAGMGIAMIENLVYLISGMGTTGAITQVVTPTFDHVSLTRKSTCNEQNFTGWDFTNDGAFNIGEVALPYQTDGFQMTLIEFNVWKTAGTQTIFSKTSCGTANLGGFWIGMEEGVIFVGTYGTNTVVEGLPTIMANTSYTIHVTYQVSNPVSGVTNLMTIAVDGVAISMQMTFPSEALAHQALIGGGCHPLYGTISSMLIDCAQKTYPYLQNFDTLPICSSSCEIDDCVVPYQWKNTPVTYDHHVPPILTQAGWRVGHSTATDWTGPQQGDHTYSNGAGNFLYVETSSPCTTATEWTVKTPWFSVNDPAWRPIQGDITLSFWYHIYGANVSLLHVDAEANGRLYKDVTTPIKANYNQWRKATIILNPYLVANVSLIQFTFRYTTLGDGGDVAIDDVMFDVPAFKPDAAETWTIITQNITVYLDGVSDLGNTDDISIRDGDCTTLCACDPIETFYGQLLSGSGLTREIQFTPYRYYPELHVCINRNDGYGEHWLGNLQMTSHFTYLEEPTVGRTTVFDIRGGLAPYANYEAVTMRVGDENTTDCNQSATVTGTQQTVCYDDYCTFTVNPTEAVTHAFLCLNRDGQGAPRWYLGPTFRVNNPFTFDSTLLMNGTVRNIIRVTNQLDGLDGGLDALSLYEGECTTGIELPPNAFYPTPTIMYENGVSTYRDIYFSSASVYYPTAQISVCRTLKGIRARLGDMWAIQEAAEAIEIGQNYKWDFRLMNLMRCSACDTDGLCLCTSCENMPSGLSYGGQVGFNPHPDPDDAYDINMYVEGKCDTNAVLTTPLVKVTPTVSTNLYIDLQYRLNGLGQPIIEFDTRGDYTSSWTQLQAPFTQVDPSYTRRIYTVPSSTTPEQVQLRVRYTPGTLLEQDFSIDNIEIGQYSYWTDRDVYLGIPFKIRIPSTTVGERVEFFTQNCSGDHVLYEAYQEHDGTYIHANVSFHAIPDDVIYVCKINGATATEMKPPIDLRMPATLLAAPRAWQRTFTARIEGLPDYDPAEDQIKLTVGTCFGGCVTVPEHKTLELSCPGGRIEQISYASYGTTSDCQGNYMPNVQICHATNSWSIINSICLGMTNCTIHASNDIFGDPCSSQVKNLRVEFQCQLTGDTTNLGPPSGWEMDGSTLVANFTPNATFPDTIMCLKRPGWGSFSPLSANFPTHWHVEDATVTQQGLPFNTSLLSIDIFDRYGFDSDARFEIREGTDCSSPFVEVVKGIQRLTVQNSAFDLKNLALVPKTPTESLVVCQLLNGMTTQLQILPLSVIDITEVYSPGTSYKETFDTWPRLVESCSTSCMSSCQAYPSGYEFGTPSWSLYRPQNPSAGPSDDHSSSPEGCYIQTPNGCPDSPVNYKADWYRETSAEANTPSALTYEDTCIVTTKAAWESLCGVTVEAKWVPPGSFLYWNSTDVACSTGASVQVSTPWLLQAASDIGAVPTLVFYYHIWGNGEGSLHIDGRAHTLQGWTEDIYPVLMEDTAGWKLFSASLPASLIPEHQFRFRFEPLGSDESFVGLDDFEVVVPGYALQIPAMGMPTLFSTKLTASETISFRSGGSCSGTRRGTFIYQNWAPLSVGNTIGLSSVNIIFADQYDDLVVCTHKDGVSTQLNPNINVGNLVQFDWEPVVSAQTIITIDGRADFDRFADTIVVRKDTCAGADIHNATGETYHDATNLYFKFIPLEAYPTTVVCLMRTAVLRDGSRTAQFNAMTRTFPVHAAVGGIILDYNLPSQLFMVGSPIELTINMTEFDVSNPGSIFFFNGPCGGTPAKLATKLISTYDANGFAVTVTFAEALSTATICHRRNQIYGAVGQLAVADFSYSLTGVTVVDNLFTLVVTSTQTIDVNNLITLRKDSCEGQMLAAHSPTTPSKTATLSHVLSNSSWLGSVSVCLSYCGSAVCTAGYQISSKLHFSEFDYTYQVLPTWIELVDTEDIDKIDIRPGTNAWVSTRHQLARCTHYTATFGDQTSCMVSMAAPFPMFDSSIYNIWMNTNGFLSNTSTTGENNICPLTGAPGEDRLMILNDDLVTQGFYFRNYRWSCPHVHNTADGCSVFTWTNITRKVDGLAAIGSTNYGQMQAILWPATGDVVYQYSDFPFTDSATIGITNAEGTDGLAAVCNAPNTAMRRKEVLFCRGPCNENPTLYMGFLRDNATAFNETYFKEIIAYGAGVLQSQVTVLSVEENGSPLVSFQLTGLYRLAQQEAQATLNKNFNNGSLQLLYDNVDEYITTGHLLSVSRGAKPMANVSVSGSAQEGRFTVFTATLTTDSNFYGLPMGGKLIIGVPPSRSVEVSESLVTVTIASTTYSGSAISVDGQQITVDTSGNPLIQLNDGAELKIVITGVRTRTCRYVVDWVFYFKTTDGKEPYATTEWAVAKPTLPCFSDCASCQYSHAHADKVSDIYLCSKEDGNGDILRWKRVSVRNPDGSTFCNSCGTSRCDSNTRLLG